MLAQPVVAKNTAVEASVKKRDMPKFLNEVAGESVQPVANRYDIP
jgi:hypothetical protein